MSALLTEDDVDVRSRSECTLPVFADDTPIMFEDEGQEHMGDSWAHSSAMSILYFGLMSHFATRQPATPLQNMNLHYHAINRRAYVSPDVMVVPVAELPLNLRSYRIGKTGPVPILTMEVLSRRTAQQGDLTLKPDIYADIGVQEYWMVDTSGNYLEDRLVCKRLASDGEWMDDYGDENGIESRYGFRLFFNSADELRVQDADTGEVYLNPDEVRDAQQAVCEKEQLLREVMAEKARLLAEVERLKLMLPPTTGS